MKRILAFILGIMMVAAMAGCGQSVADTGNSAVSGAEQKAESETEQNTDSGSNESKTETEDGSKVLVAYFSLAGEQYNVGVIEEGNTSIVAKMIANKTGADLFEIEPVNEYPSSHSELLTVAQNEQRENARPEIKSTVENMDDYDTIYIGYPNWWGDMPMIVYNFLESYDFNGKTVIPFCTHGGSGLSRTESTIAEICKGATMLDGFAIAGETAQNNREKTDSEVTNWLEKIGQ
ncbi:Flavodoxin [Lachnospiraceae bacterium TWA4]|nr:Flavodoxin [Lachnospiraceae bacterium TWA4]